MSLRRLHRSQYQSDEISRLHRKLLYTTIAIDYLHETVDDGRQKLRFVAACKEYFRTPVEDSLEDVDEILEHLERRDLLGIGNYKILKDIVKFNAKIIEEIEKTEIAIRQIGGTVTPHTENGYYIYLVAEVENSTTNEDEWKSATIAIKKIQIDLQSHHMKLTAQNSHNFEWFSRNLEIHLNLMKESNTILRLCEADEKDERIKNFVELAKASKEKLISNDDAFHEFSIRWRTLNKLMIENCKLIEFLQGKGAEFEGYIQSSLFVFLSFRSLEMLDSFWNDYKSGSLNREMRNAFFTDGGPENENQALRLNLSEENYHRYRRFLENQLRTGHDEAAGGDTQQEEPTSITNEDIITVSTDISSGEHKATTSHSNVSLARSPPAKRIRKAEGQISKPKGGCNKGKKAKDNSTTGPSSSGKLSHINKQAESTQEEIRIASLGKTDTDVNKQAESTEEETRIASLGKTDTGKSSTDVKRQAQSTEEEIRIASRGKTGADVKKQAQSMEEEIRIVLLGKTGAGKSSTGNLLLGARKFKTGFSPISVSKQCGREEVTTNDKKYIIIDTPGFFDTRDIDKDQLNTEISRYIALTSPGPHVLLFIQAPSRCTEEEERSIQEFLKVFGEDACKHMILVYVRKDEFEQNKVTFENYLKMLPKFWTKFISMCENRVLCINNMESTEAECLRSEIDKLVSKNKRNYFYHDFSIGKKMHLDSDEKMFSSDEDKGSKKQFASTSKNIEGKMEKNVQYLDKYQADKEIGFLKNQLSLKQEELKQMKKEDDERLWQRKERARSNFESELRRRQAECQRLQAQLETERRRRENRVLCINNMESTEAECLRSEIDKLVSKNKRNYFYHDFSIGKKMHLDSDEKMFSSDEDKGSKKQFASTSKNIEGKMEKNVQYLDKYQADKEIGFLKNQLSLKQEELKQMKKEDDERLWQRKERARSNFESELRRRQAECQRLQAQLETERRRRENRVLCINNMESTEAECLRSEIDKLVSKNKRNYFYHDFSIGKKMHLDSDEKMFSSDEDKGSKKQFASTSKNIEGKMEKNVQYLDKYQADKEIGFLKNQLSLKQEELKQMKKEDDERLWQRKERARSNFESELRRRQAECQRLQAQLETERRRRENRVLCINNMESTEAECLRSEIDKLVSKNKRNYFYHDFSIGKKMHLDSDEKMFSSDEDKGSKKQFASTSKNIEGKMEKNVQYLDKYQADKEIGFLKNQLSLKQEELKQMKKEDDERLWQRKERARSNFESELRRRQAECQRLQAQLETERRRREAESQRLLARFERGRRDRHCVVM